MTKTSGQNSRTNKYVRMSYDTNASTSIFTERKRERDMMSFITKSFCPGTKWYNVICVRFIYLAHFLFVEDFWITVYRAAAHTRRASHVVHAHLHTKYVDKTALLHTHTPSHDRRQTKIWYSHNIQWEHVAFCICSNNYAVL